MSVTLEQLKAVVEACPLMATTTCNTAEQHWIERAKALLAPEPEPPFIRLFDRVAKIGGDYQFEGTVQAVLSKRSGATRYVVEDDRGVLHIYSRRNLALLP